MRVSLLHAIALAAALIASSPAGAWLLYPDRDDPARLVVEIERPYGDVVPFGSLPPPFNMLVRGKAGSQSLLFRWPYGREAIGSASLTVDETGLGSIEFEFVARQLVDGQRLGAAAVLVGKDGTPLHTFYARADTLGGVFDDGTKFHSVRLVIERPLEWWRKVDSIVFFNMSYHPIQKLDDQGVWAAMQRAVWHYTKGQGTEQRGLVE
jgi:hypothetical protein